MKGILWRGTVYPNANQMAAALNCGRGAIYKALKRGTYHGSPIIRV
ncbi:hypothetical protein [Phaeobacter sp. JH209A]